MNDDGLGNPNNAPDPELDTTPPNPGAQLQNTGWQMPDPVFQQSSGYLPQGYLEQIAKFQAAEEAVTDSPDASDTPDVPNTSASVNQDTLDDSDIPAPPPGDDSVDEITEPVEIMSADADWAGFEPQPQVPEELSFDDIAATPVALQPQRTGAARIIAFLLVALVFLVIALSIVGVAYYLFLAESPANSNF
ncbi:MAG: hypothetical protein H0V76_06350 [Blastocatellia bacterium]|nr:hypothetical protein [Blastocatellia bacterium]